MLQLAPNQRWIHSYAYNRAGAHSGIGPGQPFRHFDHLLQAGQVEYIRQGSDKPVYHSARNGCL